MSLYACVPGEHRGQKRALDSLGVNIVVGRHVDMGNWTRVQKEQLLLLTTEPPLQFILFLNFFLLLYILFVRTNENEFISVLKLSSFPVPFAWIENSSTKGIGKRQFLWLFLVWDFENGENYSG